MIWILETFWDPGQTDCLSAPHILSCVLAPQAPLILPFRWGSMTLRGILLMALGSL